jgi:hypothetical protein
MGAVVANVCFCAGPILEYYLGLAHLRGPWIRGGLFALGSALAILLALGSLMASP